MEYGYSVVRRKLLLKNRGPQDAPGLCARALQAYGHGEYQEALDLAWAAVQLDGQDARFWYAMALSERAVGDVDLARASARHAAALDLLARGDSLAGLERTGTAGRAFLRRAAAGLTRDEARQILGESTPGQPLGGELARKSP